MCKILKSFKIITVTLLLLISSLAPTIAKEPLNVITSFTILQDMAQNVVGDRAIVSSIIKSGIDPHDYQPTPKDIAKVGDADLIIWNGLGMEHWFKRFFENSDAPIIIASNGIVEIMDSDQEGHGGVANLHAWMSLKNGLIYVDNIRDALMEHDPDNASFYKKNAAKYKKRIKALDHHLEQAFNTIPEERRWIVTNESSMTYFADRYGFKEAYIWNATSDEEGSPKHVRDLIQLVRDQQIEHLFSEHSISDRSMKQIEKETEAKYEGQIYTHALSTEEGRAPTYLNLIDVTANVILRAYGVDQEE